MLPDRYLLLERLDQLSTRVKGGSAVLSTDCHHHCQVTDREVSDPVAHRDRDDVVGSRDLVGHGSQNVDRLRMGGVVKAGHGRPIMMVTHDPDEDPDSSDAGVGHGGQGSVNAQGCLGHLGDDDPARHVVNTTGAHRQSLATPGTLGRHDQPAR